MSYASPSGIAIVGEYTEPFANVLTWDCQRFLLKLQRLFGDRVEELLARRIRTQEKIDNGYRPGFLESTRYVRNGDWQCAPIPHDIEDRRIEITGPVDRKMVINALNSGAKVFMADFEDSHCPTWDNTMNGHINMIDGNKETIAFTDEKKGKHYKLNPNPAVLMIRPRGWHLPENHILVDGKPMSGSLADFGIYFFHNAKIRLGKGSAPYFYLAKLESHLEARLWNEVFLFAQDYIGIPRGTIRATVLIETILAAFEMDEILYELREHSAGLNCGRWDYMFSVVKKFRNDKSFVFPDRAEVGMDKHFLSSYVRLLVQTCHKRGIHAMGGMAAQIPIKTDKAANDKALAKVHKDKLTEVKEGHDGTWVAHPGLVKVARDIFDEHMPQANQISNLRKDVSVTSNDLLTLGTEGCKITRAGLEDNVRVSILYTEAWLRGTGCVPLNHLMEDAATAEIARSQLWQWIRHGSKIDGEGTTITEELVLDLLEKTRRGLHAELSAQGAPTEKLNLATDLVQKTIVSKDFVEFIPSIAYPYVTKIVSQAKL